MQSKKFQVLFLAGALLSSEVDGIKRGRGVRSAQSDDSSSEIEILSLDDDVVPVVDDGTNTFSIEVDPLRRFGWCEWAFGTVEMYKAKVSFSGEERQVEFRYSEKKEEYKVLQNESPYKYPDDFPLRPTSGCFGWSWHSDRVREMHNIFNDFFNSNPHVIAAFWRKKFFTDDVLTQQAVIEEKLLELEDQFSKIKGSSALNMLKAAGREAVTDEQFSALSQVVEKFQGALESVCQEEQILIGKINEHKELMNESRKLKPLHQPVENFVEAEKQFADEAKPLQLEYNSFFEKLNGMEKSEDVFDALNRIVEEFNQQMLQRNPFDPLHDRLSCLPKFGFDEEIQHAEAFVVYLQKMQASYELIPKLIELQKKVTKKFAKCKPHLPANEFDLFLGQSLFEEVLDYNDSSSWKIVSQDELEEKISELKDTLESDANPFVEQLHLGAIKRFAHHMASYSNRSGNFDPTRLFAGPKGRSGFAHSVVLDFDKSFQPLSSDTKISVRGDEVEQLALDQILRSDFVKATWPDISVDKIKAAFDADRDHLKQIVKNKTYEVSSKSSGSSKGGVEHFDKDMEAFNIENLVFGSFTNNWLFQTYFKYASKQFSMFSVHPDQKARWQARTQILKSLCHQSLLLWMIREMDTEFWAKLAHIEDLSKAQKSLREIDLVSQFKYWAAQRFHVTISDGDIKYLPTKKAFEKVAEAEKLNENFQTLRDDFLKSEYFSAYQAYFKSLMPKLHTYVQKGQQFDDSHC